MKNGGQIHMECFTYLRNIQDLLSDGKTPHGRRSGEPSKGPIIPFGSLVEYYPISAKDQSRIHQFGKTWSLHWIVADLDAQKSLYAVRIWKMDDMRTSTLIRRSGTENIDFNTGPPNSRRRSKRFSWRTRRVSTFTTSRLISGCR